MKRLWLRSIIFNLCFFIVTAFFCIAYIPFLILPRRWFINAVEFWLRLVGVLERSILGLSLEIRGLENLPLSGSYIVAAKHQSAYETMKLHLLFRDPAVILKRELIWIPLWGAYLWKSNVIAINRASPESARRSINEGALRMKEQGRPIIIFPQGTRVHPEATTQEKPYKSGIAGIQEAAGLPIIPLAMNSGMFWPRGGFFKSGGKVIFEFLDPIEPGKEKRDLMTMLEQRVENTSSALMNEARIAALEEKGGIKGALVLIVFLAALFGAYSFAWFKVADGAKREYNRILYDLSGETTRPSRLYVHGFPGPVQLDVKEETIATDEGSITITNLHASAWPLPLLPIHITSGPATLRSIQWSAPITLDSIETHLRTNLDATMLTITDSEIKLGGFSAEITGDIDLNQEPIPALNLSIALENYQLLLSNLAQKNIIDPRSALFMGAGFSALADEDGIVRVPLVQRDNKLYAGPLPILDIPVPDEPKQPRRQQALPTPPPVSPEQAASPLDAPHPAPGSQPDPVQ